MANAVVMMIITLTAWLAIRYIAKQKKKGVRCIGCPSAGTCAAKSRGGCGNQA